MSFTPEQSEKMIAAHTFHRQTPCVLLDIAKNFPPDSVNATNIEEILSAVVETTPSSEAYTAILMKYVKEFALSQISSALDFIFEEKISDAAEVSRVLVSLWIQIDKAPSFGVMLSLLAQQVELFFANLNSLEATSILKLLRSVRPVNESDKIAKTDLFRILQFLPIDWKTIPN